jgi:hypothetical protein
MSSLDDAKNYVGARFAPNYTAWLELSDDDKGRTLVSADDFIDSLAWQGTATGTLNGNPTSRQWPRSGIEGVDPTTIPNAIVEASFELAVMIAASPDLPNKLDQGSNISSASGGGGVSVSYFAPTSARTGTATLLPPIVQRKVGRYLAMPSDDGSFGSPGLKCSAFAARRQYSLGWPED